MSETPKHKETCDRCMHVVTEDFEDEYRKPFLKYYCSVKRFGRRPFKEVHPKDSCVHWDELPSGLTDE